MRMFVEGLRRKKNKEERRMRRALFGLSLAVALYALQPRWFPGPPSPDFQVQTSAPLMDAIFAQYPQLGDLTAYRNHCLRVKSYALWFHDFDMDVLEAALAYHDIGLWFGELNYLTPSADLAQRDLNFSTAQIQLVRAMIESHHKWTSTGDPMVDAFRKADWLDFTYVVGLPLRSGMPAGNVAKAVAELPTAGFLATLMAFPGIISPDNIIRGNLEIMKIFKL